MIGVSFKAQHLSSYVRRRRSRSQIPNRTPARNPLVLVPSKNSDVRQTGSRNWRPSSFKSGWYPERFPIDPEKIGFLARPVPEISWENPFRLRGRRLATVSKIGNLSYSFEDAHVVRRPARGRLEIPSASAPFRLCTLENVKRISGICAKQWTNDGVGYDVRELLHTLRVRSRCVPVDHLARNLPLVFLQISSHTSPI